VVSVPVERMDRRKEAFPRDERRLFRRYHTQIQGHKDNKPDTLEDQLNALREIGFIEADCYYKYGIFAMYGGRK